MKRWLIVTMAALAFPAAAQNYPNKVVRIIGPFAAGGGIDVLARQIAQKLNESYGQFFMVENRAGATGTMGAAIVAKSPPDGYNLILHSSSTYIAPYLYRSVPYDAVRSFAPVVNCVMYPFYIVAAPSLPAKNVRELIALAKKNLAQLTYATPGYGSGGHLVMEMLNTAAGLKLVQIPYKGSASWLTAVGSGEVALGITSILTAQPLVKVGKLHGMAVTSAKRSPAVPEVPTMIESGLPGFEANLWAGLFSTAGTPAAIVNQLNTSVTRILTTAEMKDWLLQSMGGEFTSNTPEQFSEFLASDTARWRKVIKDNNVHLD
ncbi:MAG TPA: tripartite tricarboxylate transporter substrate binding protein [Burkholderiales bacterium]|nr:tripartite tricarboxylate transporter substrate binding protein [Burkholderiales bacterium]